MNLHFSIALLPDLIVLLGVGGAALKTSAALPAHEIRWVIFWVGWVHRRAFSSTFRACLSANLRQIQAQKLGWIEHGALPADSPVQVRASDSARGSAQTYLLAGGDSLAGFYVDTRQVH